jgi:hypothetical protein
MKSRPNAVAVVGPLASGKSTVLSQLEMMKTSGVIKNILTLKELDGKDGQEIKYLRKVFPDLPALDCANIYWVNRFKFLKSKILPALHDGLDVVVENGVITTLVMQMMATRLYENPHEMNLCFGKMQLFFKALHFANVHIIYMDRNSMSADAHRSDIPMVAEKEAVEELRIRHLYLESRNLVRDLFPQVSIHTFSQGSLARGASAPQIAAMKIAEILGHNISSF